MSHKATNWAFSMSGLKPATKLVLVALADRHNADTGQCDPSQDRLAEQCGMARSTLNVHLKALEEMGLIKRIQRSDRRTRRQEKTLYLLALPEEEPARAPRAVSGNRTRKGAEPCPENAQSRVRKMAKAVSGRPDTNRKGTVRNAGAREAHPPARVGARPYFHPDERFRAQQIAERLREGGTVDPGLIPERVGRCLIVENMITAEQAETLGIC